MKMNFAGVLPNPNAVAENFRYNCTRNKACQKEYFIPVAGLCDFMLYFELPFRAFTYEISIVDSCTAEVIAASAINYVIAEHTGGNYAVFGGLTSVSLPTFFYLKASFFDADDHEAVFFSNDFEIVTCEQLTKVESCYNNPTVGTPAFDLNGVYYGFPVGEHTLGNPTYRYYHFLNVRKGAVMGNKTKLSLNAFNYSKVYKAQTLQQYLFSSELVPEFYKEEILAVIARGNIIINGAGYQVADEIDLSINNEDAKLWIMDILLNKVIFSFFSCSATICNYNPCSEIVVPEPDPCCTPVLTAALSETVTTPPPVEDCISYDVSGNDENSYVDFTDCNTGETVELNIGNTVVTVCSTTVPTGGGISITTNGPCNP